jgi:tripartite-type tricarboxylate transporter receptor subunit TctC
MALKRETTSMQRRNLLLGVGAAGAGLLAAPALLKAQGAWPRGPITIVVPFAAGGITDRTARHLQPLLQRELGVPIGVVNITGAAGAVGKQHVFDQPADGNTILQQTDAIRTYPAMAQSDRTWRDFDMIGVFVIATTYLVVRPDHTIRNATDFLRELRAEDGRLSIGNSGPGTMGHVAMTAFVARENIRYNSVVFPGHAPAQAGLLRGDVGVVTTDAATARELIIGRRIRPVFHWAAQPTTIPGFGDIPGVSPELRSMDDLLPLGGWFGPAVKRGTPAPIIERLTQAYARAAADPASQRFRDDTGLLPGGLLRDEANAFAERETRRISWMLHDTGRSLRDPATVGLERPAA